MTKVAPREEDFKGVMMQKYSSILLIYMAQLLDKPKQTTNWSEPFSFLGKPTLEFTRHYFHRGLCPGFSSTCYLPTVRHYALQWKTCTFCVKPCGFLELLITLPCLMLTLFYLLSAFNWDNCTSKINWLLGFTSLDLYM